MSAIQKKIFDLNLWCLNRLSKESFDCFQAAYRHDLDGLMSLGDQLKKNQISSVNILHLFACGTPQSGTHHSRIILNYLLEHSGILEQIDAYGWLPINYAAYFANTQTLDLLLEAGSPVQNKNGPQPLDSALIALSQNGEHSQSAETCARYLLMHGADPKQGLTTDPHWGGVTWLTWALSHDRFDWAELLMHKGSTTLTQKEKHLLLMRGSPEAIAWAEYKGMDVVGMMTSKHEAYEMARRAKALREGENLRSVLVDTMNEKKWLRNSENEEGQEGERSGGKRLL